MSNKAYTFYFMKFGSDAWDDDFEEIHGGSLEDSNGFFYIYDTEGNHVMAINKNQVGRWWVEPFEDRK